MNFQRIEKTDLRDSYDGACVSLWFNGCDIRCKGCHNQSLWDKEYFVENDQVVKDLFSVFLERDYTSLSILGGEPLTPDNRKDCLYIVKSFAKKYPDKKIRLWTGRTLEQILITGDPVLGEIISYCYEIITGPFVEELKDKKLRLRGSSNQVIYRNVDGHLVDVSKEVDKLF